MLSAIDQKTSSQSRNDLPRVPLTALEAEVIGLFVQISRMIGQPRSYAEIYGLLFISPCPITMDDVIERLGMSKGSASQGLRFLRRAGAIRVVYVAGDRRTHYGPVAELRRFVTGLLRDQILPQLESSQQRLDHIAEMAEALPPEERAHLASRIGMLQSWGEKSRNFLPMVVKILEG